MGLSPAALAGYRLRELKCAHGMYTVDRDVTDLSAADLEHGSGTLHSNGNVELDGDPVRYITSIEI